jgi:hypothetical protein
VETIEWSAQEALRAKEEITVVETIEAQRRGFLLNSEAQTRGILVMAEAQRVIDQFQNDPYLIEMTRVPADNPITRRG